MNAENDIPKNDPSPNTNGESDEHPDHSEPEVPAALGSPQFPPAHTHHEITSQQEKNWWEKAKPFVEIVGIILLAIYTGYTIKMYGANRDAADAAVRTIRIDNRPWLYVYPGKLELKDGKPALIPVNIVNQGKTAAFKVHAQICVIYLPNGEEPEFAYTQGHPGFDFHARALMPNSPQELRYGVFSKTLDPNKPYQPVTVTKEFRDKFERNEIYVVVYGRIFYEDVFGTSHWIQYCSMTENIIPGIQLFSASQKCGQYEDTDRNF